MADPNPFESRGDYINGEFVLPERTEGEIPVEDPGDTSALSGAFPYSAESADQAVAAARKAWPAWRDSPLAERSACLERFAEVMESEKKHIANVIAREVGKPVWEALTEVGAMIGKIGITLGPGMESVGERYVDMGGGQVGDLHGVGGNCRAVVMDSSRAGPLARDLRPSCSTPVEALSPTNRASWGKGSGSGACFS